MNSVTKQFVATLQYLNMISGPVVLVTGGCGYIGSHTITCLLNSPQKYSVVVVDNLSNSSPRSLDRVAEICGLDEKSRKDRLIFRDVDLCNEVAFRQVFEELPQFAACIHFAGLKVRCIYFSMYYDVTFDYYFKYLLCTLGSH